MGFYRKMKHEMQGFDFDTYIYIFAPTPSVFFGSFEFCNSCLVSPICLRISLSRFGVDRWTRRKRHLILIRQPCEKFRVTFYELGIEVGDRGNYPRF